MASDFLPVSFVKAYVCSYAFYNNSEAGEKIILRTKMCEALLKKAVVALGKLVFQRRPSPFLKTRPMDAFVRNIIFCLLKQIAKRLLQTIFSKRNRRNTSHP